MRYKNKVCSILAFSILLSSTIYPINFTRKLTSRGLNHFKNVGSSTSNTSPLVVGMMVLATVLPVVIYKLSIDNQNSYHSNSNINPPIVSSNPSNRSNKSQVLKYAAIIGSVVIPLLIILCGSNKNTSPTDTSNPKKKFHPKKKKLKMEGRKVPPLIEYFYTQGLKEGQKISKKDTKWQRGCFSEVTPTKKKDKKQYLSIFKNAMPKENKKTDIAPDNEKTDVKPEDLENLNATDIEFLKNKLKKLTKLRSPKDRVKKIKQDYKKRTKRSKSASGKNFTLLLRRSPRNKKTPPNKE